MFAEPRRYDCCSLSHHFVIAKPPSSSAAKASSRSRKSSRLAGYPAQHLHHSMASMQVSSQVEHVHHLMSGALHEVGRRIGNQRTYCGWRLAKHTFKCVALAWVSRMRQMSDACSKVFKTNRRDRRA